MARTRSVDFLPEIFRTPVNRQFLAATLDTLTQEPKFKKTQGFIGRTVGPGVDPNDKYVVEPDSTRQNYQLEPGVVSLKPDTNTIKNVITYPGMNSAIGFQGGDSTRADQLYSSDYYTWDPFVDFDTFVNFSQYFWVPDGPPVVDVAAVGVPTTDNFVVTRENGVYTFSGVAGENPTLDLVRGGSYTFQVAQNAKETVNFRVTNNGIASYLIDSQPNPTITLARGNTYVFNLNLTGNYPFWIKTQPVIGTQDPYNSGVSRNGSTFGLVTFVVPQDAPDTLYYSSETQPNLHGTFNIVNGTPGTGPGFWIQTAPGIDGTIPSTPNISDRDIYGVSNNGEDLGMITFEVPQKTAQEFYFNLKDVGPIDLLTTLQFDQINNQPLNEFITQYGGIDGTTYLDARTLVFINDVVDATDGGWLQTTLYDPLEQLAFATPTGTMVNSSSVQTYSNITPITQLGTGNSAKVTVTLNANQTAYSGTNTSFVVTDAGAAYNVGDILRITGDQLGGTSPANDLTFVVSKSSGNYLAGSFDSTVSYSQTTEVPFSDRYQVWQINLVNRQGTDYISLAKVSDVNLNEKFTISYGITYSNTSWYKNSLGVFQQIPLLTANLDTLYYQDGTDPNIFGRIRLLEQTDSETLYISEILGKKNYISPNGVTFTNGLKVKFTGTVYPASYSSGNTTFTCTATQAANNYITTTSTAGLYEGEQIVFPSGTLGGIESGRLYYIKSISANGIQFSISYVKDGETVPISTATGTMTAVAISDNQYYISGVGTAIELLPVRDFITPESYVVDANDSTIASEPNELDYLTISRASKDLNAWTRSNRWFHVDVLNAAATYNNTVAVLDNNYRAKRPIIQFRPNIRLYNMGSSGKQPVDVIDFSESDALSNVEGSTGYSVDGYTFVDGSRVVFAADTDANVRNKVYTVQFITPDTVPPLIAQPIIHLVPTADSEVLADQSIVCLDGNTTKGLTFWYDGATWNQAQLKTKVQQAPLFDVYDLDGVSFGNQVKYQSSTFIGSKLFSYAVGDTTVLDPILQFPLQYLNINNVGDIVFENNLYKDTFLYVQDNVSITSDISSGAVREYADRTVYAKLIGWQNAITTSQIYQQFKFTYTGQTLKLDVAVKSDTVVPAIKIYAGSQFQKPSSYSYVVGANSTTITLNNVYLPTDVIEVLVLSDQTSQIGFYQVPLNLESNPLNGNSDSFTLGTVRTHYESICENLTTLTGAISGANNTRDLGNIVPYGLVILQQSAPLTLAGYFLRSQEYNIFSSLQYNSQEYLKFKNQMLEAVTQQTIQFQTAAQILDTAMSNITLGRVETQPFYWSDMVPSGTIYQETTYTVSFTTTNIFDTLYVYNFTSANYQGINVYLNDNILTRGLNYTVATDGPRIIILDTLSVGDVITIREYTTTYGNFVPNTPTKLGLYPAWQPQYINQKTSTGEALCILGHDGSITKAFNDIRDEVLIEFEKRIYNNLKLDGNPVPLSIVDVLPGEFRTTGYSEQDITNILSQDFLSYVAWNKLDYRTQDYRAGNEFTYNYSGSQSRLNNGELLGAWRGIYRYYYDTQQPEQMPWEMLGLTVKPTWWNTVYGPGPYTQDNLVLWDDLAGGLVADPVSPYFVYEYARPASYTSTNPADSNFEPPRGGAWATSKWGRGPYPKLQPVIPTGTEGDLLSPLNSVVGSYNDQTFRKSWQLGDGGPVEASWWNSSAYPFAVMRLLALTRPAKFFALFADRDLYRYNDSFNQYLYNNRYRLNANDIQIYGNGVSKASYIDWIVDFNRQSGLDTTVDLTADLGALDVRLCYRMASFSDKQYIKIYTEKSSPNSVNTTFLIPDDSYDLLLYKNQPFDRASYSAVVIQKTAGGYAVFGYSTTQPYFDILQSQFTGQLQTFSSGGVTVQVPTFYTNQVTQVPYGTVFTGETAVATFLISYGKYLEQQGLTFTDTTNGYILNWDQMVNEFLYWSQQGWEENALINLNPLAFKLSITRDQAVVDSIQAQTADNILLDQNRRELPTRNLIITRLDNTFTAEPATDQTLSYIDIKYTSYEHMIVLNNVSTFGDLIYQPTTGARQSRLNLIASTTTEWNGSVDAQGFILNQNNIQAWDPYKTYVKGEIVTYKGTYWSAADIVQPSTLFNTNNWYQSDYTRIELGLLPNLANKANQLQNSYNINEANLESDNDLLSYGLIGFRPRQYMTSLNLDDVSQLNIYRQFLDSKGTILSAELFEGANLGKEAADYSIYENWAVQRAVYGANANRSFFQLRLDRALLDSNPSLVQVVVPGEISEADQTIFLKDVWRESYKLTSPDILPVTTSLPTDIGLPTAGYVNLNDVDITVFDIADTASLAANIDNINVGTSVWVAKTNSYDWNIYRAQAVPGTIAHVCDNLDGTSIVIFTEQHNLSVNDKLIVRFFDAEVNGIYSVISVPGLDTVTIAFSFTGDRTVVNGIGLGFTLKTMRVGQASDILNLPYANTISPGAKVWVDNNGDGLWEVIQKQEVFDSLTELAPLLTDVDEQYGSSVAQAQNRFAALVGSPRFRFPAGATLWSIANSYAEFSIVYVVDPYQTEFFYAPAPVPQGISVYDLAYWTPYSLNSLPRKGGVYVYVKSDSNQYTPVSPLNAQDAVLTLDVTGVRGYGNAVDFGTKDWAVAGASASLGSTSVADNGYACVIYREPELGAPGTVPYAQWQLLTNPESTTDTSEFGYSVAMSQDERWMYVGAPGTNKVYAYGLVPWENQFVNYFGNGVTTTFDIGSYMQLDAATQVQVAVGGAGKTLGTDYTIDGSFATLTFVTAPASGAAIEIQRINRKLLDYQIYYGVAGTGGTGANATFTVTRIRGTVTVDIQDGGTGYTNGDTITILATSFDGGTVPANNITFTVTVASGVINNIVGTPSYTPPALATVFSLNEYFFTADNINSFSVIVDNVLQRPTIDYTFSNVTKDLTFVTVPTSGAEILIRAQNYFQYSGYVTVSGINADARFGHSISCGTDGRQVIVGAPYKDTTGTINTVSTVSGIAVAGTMTYNNVTQNSTSGTGTGAQFTVTRSNGSYSVTVTKPGQGYALGDTITVTGVAFGGTSLNNLTITVGSTATAVTSYTESGAVYVFDRNVQKFIYGTDTSTVAFTVLGSVYQPVSVLVNGKFLMNADAGVTGASNTFTVSGNTVTINADLQIGDIIEIETNQFKQVQEVQQSTLEEYSNFGQSTDLCSYNCSLYSGAPQSSVQQFKGGIVERNVNQSRVYGIISSSISCPNLANGDTIRVNDQDVVVPGSWNNATAYSTNTVVYYTYNAISTVYIALQNVSAGTSLSDTTYWSVVQGNITNTNSVEVIALAAQINADVPNVNATVSSNGYLTLAVKNSAAADVGNKLQVAPGSVGTTFADLALESFAYTQTINNPYPIEFAGFGTSLSIDNSAINLVVGAPRGTLYIPTIFDDNTTDWDAGATEFFDLIVQSGAVYTFDLLPSADSTVTNPGKFVFGQQIVNSHVAQYDKFGTAVSYVSGVLMTGAPGNELDDSTMSGNYGRVFISENPNRVPAWTVLRVQPPVVDVRLLNSVYAYDRITSATATYFDFFNPLQGKILGAAKQNIDYIGAVDPASYNVGPVGIRGTTWGSDAVGEVWWDTSTVRFIDPSQDSIVYASRRWGQIFPGSSVDVYQWVVSDVPPGSYTGPGIPRDTLSYVINTVLSSTGTFNTEYYFWVSGLTTIATQKGKTLPISTVSNYIADPKSSGIAYIAPIDASTIALYNAADYIQASDTIISIEFDRELTDDNVHVEYELIPQDKAAGWLSDNLYRKLQDSFCGVDTSGNKVPDVNLGPAERYGVQFRPRQSMFVDRFAALKNYLTRANTVLARFAISESRQFNLLNSSEPEPSANSGLWDKRVANLEILSFQDINAVPVGYRYLVVSDSSNRGLWTIYTVTSEITISGAVRYLLLTRVQNYDTKQFWSYIDWILPGYNASSQIIASVPQYASLQTLDVPIGSSVKVTANAQGKYEVYLKTDIGWDRVVLQDGTIAFSAELWDYQLGRFGFAVEVFDAQYFDQEPVIETRKIIQAINEELFIDDLLIERNKALTLMFDFVLSEFAAPEWLIKTSLIDVEHRIRALLPFQNYSRDNQEFVLDYIKEVKPYHVTIREFNLRYSGFDEWFGDMSDFDLPAYFNTSLEIPSYTSPILLPYDHGTASGSQSNTQSDLPSNSTVWASWPYSQWYNNYLLRVDTVQVIEGGSGYTAPPMVIFQGDATASAEATAVLNSQGQVVAVNVTYYGEGYSSTPLVVFDGGNGSGAVAYPRMANDVVRQFRTVIRYDRFQYQTAVQTWNSNTTYENGTLVRYDDRVWSAQNADGSSAVTGPTFDLENWVLVNANTYTYPGASQATGLTGVDRTMGLYVAGANAPGLELPLLVDGVDYPGVQVWGDYFTGTQRLDANYQSEFADIYLGTRYSDINVDGGEFIGPYEGHAPEELVNGSEYDTLDMRIYTRPGSDWQNRGHGFQISTVRYTYEPAITQIYSFVGVVELPTEIVVSNQTTGYDLTKDVDYSINWANQYVEMFGGAANGDILNISIYEVGGGNQLYRAFYTGQEVIDNNDEIIVPVSYKEITEVAVFIDGEPAPASGVEPYVESIAWDQDNTYSALDIVFNNNVITCTSTSGTYNTITCSDTSALTIGQPIVFSGSVFGGITAGTTYYVLSIANSVQFFITDVSGSSTVFPLTTDSGSMAGNPTGTYYRAVQTVTPGIALTNTAYWVPFVPNLASKVTITGTFGAPSGLSVVILGSTTAFAITQTGSTAVTPLSTGTNIVVQGDTSAISVGQSVVFFGTSLGGIAVEQEYYVLSIVNSTTFTIESTLGSGIPVTLLSDTATWTGELTAKFYPTTMMSWSTPISETTVADQTIVDTRLVEFTASLQGTNPANLIVTVNGLRVKPPEGIEWIGDDSSVSFGLPQRGAYSQSLIYAPTDIKVWVDNVLQVQSVGAIVGSYSVTNYAGSNTPGRQVVFTTPPAAGAKILISVSTVANYQVSGNLIQFANPINLGDIITITAWNDTAQQNILTLMFQGPITTGLTVNEPYDSTNYDPAILNATPGSYDYTIGTSIPNNDFDLQRLGVSANRLWVTLDGYRLFEGTDFTIQGQYLILANGAIAPTQVLAVTEFANSVVPEAAEFRIFQDMRGVQATYRMTPNTTTRVVQDVSITTDVIYVEDASKLSEPDLANGIFGVVTINAERIMYRSRNTAQNYISGLRRGTAGTATNTHSVGATVYDIGRGNLLNQQYQDYIVSDTGMGDGTTTVFYAPNIDIADFGDSSTAYVESIEVYVGGVRQYNYSQTQAQSQYRYIVTDFGPLAIEFVTDNNPITPLLAPAAGSEITILQRRGLSWYQPGFNTASDGVALQETDTLAARFLCNR